MKIKRCKNGHFYDMHQFKTCPHCNTAETPPIIDRVRSGISGLSQHPVDIENQPTRPAEYDEIIPEINSEIDNVTVKADLEGMDAQREVLDAEVFDKDDPVVIQPERVVVEPMIVSESRPVINVKHETVESSERMPGIENESRTVFFEDASADIEPVVGWLVSISGEHKGESYKLAVGINDIGRDEKMSVCLHRDNAVSKIKHLAVVYDPRNNRFFVQPSDSKQPSYLDDEMITEKTDLKTKSIISIGKTQLRFIAFCDDSFKW